MEENKKKILGNLSDDTHKEVMIIKATHKIKSVDDTLKFLVNIYKKDKIRKELEREEQIKNSNIKQN